MAAIRSTYRGYHLTEEINLHRWSTQRGGQLIEMVNLTYRGDQLTEVVNLQRWSTYKCRGDQLIEVVNVQRWSICRSSQPDRIDWIFTFS